MKKNFKLVLALVLAAMMIVSMIPAIAATGELEIDTDITVTGLDSGDTVNFYKIVKWVDGAGWAWEKDYETTVANLVTAPDTATKLFDRITGQNKGTDEFIPGKISKADAAILAQAAVTVSNEQAATMSGTNATLALANAETATSAQKMEFVGLYCALVTPAKADTMYNPVFVSADFSQENTSPKTQEATLGKSYDPEAQAKKETISLTKEVTSTTNGTATTGNTKYDLDVGDDVEFTITTSVPAFNGAYTKPKYILTDTMETGLAYKSSVNPTITLGEAPTTITIADPDDYSWKVSGQTITMTFTEAGLAKVSATGLAKKLTIVYTATITSLDNANITEKENEATVKFSNSPEDEDSYSLLEDRTLNYSFSIDANLLGNDSWENSELVKIGLSADGTEITQSRLSNGTMAGVLEGAEFGLYKSKAGAETETESDLYTNTVFTTGKVTSDANGKLKIDGLDAGEYYLKELKAPAGYIKDGRIFKITIAATYDHVEGGSYTKTIGGREVKVKFDGYDKLASYSVTVENADGGTLGTSTFTITNIGDSPKKSASAASPTDSTSKINNIRGTELPSTGGIGTTIFYVGGSLMVLAAAILLITKRRMGAEE